MEQKKDSWRSVRSKIGDLFDIKNKIFEKEFIEKSILLDQNKNLIPIELDKISDAKLLV